jgi:hypothetical protein
MTRSHRTQTPTNINHSTAAPTAYRGSSMPQATPSRASQSRSLSLAPAGPTVIQQPDASALQARMQVRLHPVIAAQRAQIASTGLRAALVEAAAADVPVEGFADDHRPSCGRYWLPNICSNRASNPRASNPSARPVALHQNRILVPALRGNDSATCQIDYDLGNIRVSV